MKLKEKWAKDFVRSNQCEVSDTYSAHEDTWINGFETAKKWLALINEKQLLNNSWRIEVINFGDNDVSIPERSEDEA